MTQYAKSLIARVMEGDDPTDVVDELTTLTNIGPGLPKPLLVRDKRDDDTDESIMPLYLPAADGASPSGYCYPVTREHCYADDVAEMLHEANPASSEPDDAWLFGVGHAKQGFTRDTTAAAHGSDDVSYGGKQAPANWPLNWTHGTSKQNTAYNKESISETRDFTVVLRFKDTSARQAFMHRFTRSGDHKSWEISGPLADGTFLVTGEDSCDAALDAANEIAGVEVLHSPYESVIEKKKSAFSKLVAKLRKRKDVKNPEALAAYIGRRWKKM